MYSTPALLPFPELGLHVLSAGSGDIFFRTSAVSWSLPVEGVNHFILSSVDPCRLWKLRHLRSRLLSLDLSIVHFASIAEDACI